MSGYKNILVTALAAALVLPVSAQAAKKTITFMELNDLHAHLVPHTNVVADGNGGTKVAMCGGLTRIATLAQTDSCRKP
jgi:2',3'-cyclic-nucleotide 2'-phosphodiesterase (5'-nucleotidase family)